MYDQGWTMIAAMLFVEDASFTTFCIDAHEHLLSWMCVANTVEVEVGKASNWLRVVGGLIEEKRIKPDE
ncbi:hypothetical protein AC578_1187 [Pseudocercospora eumusae]|uniref:Uncharacterized protein n=1 Tax=Pseudocercospora eumusae TaxID=321146 RepID=A0A139H078_9PEZI|nr:hypothetical protein AC578_1187 [Pseudocercospora eumusae]